MAIKKMNVFFLRSCLPFCILSDCIWTINMKIHLQKICYESIQPPILCTLAVFQYCYLCFLPSVIILAGISSESKDECEHEYACTLGMRVYSWGLAEHEWRAENAEYTVWQLVEINPGAYTYEMAHWNQWFWGEGQSSNQWLTQWALNQREDFVLASHGHGHLPSIICFIPTWHTIDTYLPSSLVSCHAYPSQPPKWVVSHSGLGWQQWYTPQFNLVMLLRRSLHTVDAHR